MGNFDRNRRDGFRKRGFNNRGFDRPAMHKAICDKCKKECEVPFRPTSGKPVFCNDCFDRPTSGRSEGRDFSRSNFEEKRMFDAVCDECKSNCQLPFHPSSDKPVYCSNCFESKGGRIGSRGKEGSNHQYEQQFALLNSKLDKVLNILMPIADEAETEGVSVAEEPLEVEEAIAIQEAVEGKPKSSRKTSKKA